VEKHEGKDCKKILNGETNRVAYSEQELEIEANTEMIHVAKFMYPEAAGSFTIGSQTYAFP